MSKQIRPQLIVRPRTLAALVAMSIAAAAIAAAARQPQEAVAGARNAAIVAATEEVLRETSEIRQLPVRRSVRSGAQSRAEIERMIIHNLDEDTTPAEMRSAELALKKFGLAPPGFQLRAFLIGLLAEQVAGYYEPKTGEFHLADWIDLDGQKPVMAHELAHALQDQHFDLRRFERWPRGDSDAELAAQALVEGDATLAMSFYVVHNPLRASALRKSLERMGGSSKQIDEAPRALRETLLFPYEQGMVWSLQLFRQGGWAQISQAFTDLPQSTEQIMHAEKYLAREAPVRVHTPDISPALGVRWKRIDYDTNGEWGLYLILDEYLKAEDESRRAAAGWGGDRYALYEDERTGRIFLAQLTHWDTELDAREFFDAYAKRTELRYKESPAAGGGAKSGAATERVWRTNEGFIQMERRGARVLIAEGVPEKVGVRTLMKILWQ